MKKSVQQRRSHTITLTCLVFMGAVAVIAPRPAAAQLIGPSPYLAFDNSIPGAGTAISPFSGLSFGNYFHLETFEDGLFNTPGVVSSSETIIVPGSITDSVDADDGLIDGFGIDGHTLFGDGPSGIFFNFVAGALGGLPTHAGIVWTDGFGTVTFQAFDAQGQLIGTLNGDHPGPTISGETDEDRFYGVIAPGGISSIFISNSSGGIEVDHLQYGLGAGGAGAAAPEPSALALLGTGLGLASGVIRRKR